MPSMIYGLLHDDKIQSSSAYMGYRFPPVYVSKSKMCLGSVTLFHHMSSLLSYRFRYLKLIILVTSGHYHAMRYESVDIVRTWHTGSNLFEGTPTVVLPISNINIKGRKFLSSVSHSLPRPSVPHSFSHTPPVRLSLHFSHSVLRFIISHSHRSRVEFRAAKHCWCCTTHVMIWPPQTVCVMARVRACGSPSTFVKLTTCAQQ